MSGVLDNGASLPRNSRKHRRLDDDPPDGGGTVDPAATVAGGTLDQVHTVSKAFSYKESLIKTTSAIPSESEELIDEDDIVFEEGDIVRSDINGVISIDFSNIILSLAEKSLELTVVVKLLGRRIGYNALRTKIYELWKPSQPIRLMDIENDYYLVSFRAHSDYKRILASGPWTYGHLQDKCPDTQQPSTVEETIVPPVSNQQRAEESSYGPWMVVERRPRKTLNKQVITINDKPGMIFQGSRFNPLRASEENVDAPSEPLAEVPIQQVRSAASIPRAKPRNKGKSTLSFSNPAIHRKPPVVNLADFPVLNRNHSKASSSSRTSLDQLRHTTVVIDENSDPNVGLPTKNSTPPQNSDQQSLMGDPPDIPALSDPPPSHGVTVDTSMQPRAIDESCEALDPAQAVAMLE
ncbi:hypothetical protein V6N11_056648 [Hibiscus sabdariffa]|uniref:DUF4283 domain-containing protein n=1 Tax=Hibiscus sabdariffa TaxID=183260 RepID=A0ABR2T5D4_9ROSI